MIGNILTPDGIKGGMGSRGRQRLRHIRKNMIRAGKALRAIVQGQKKGRKILIPTRAGQAVNQAAKGLSARELTRRSLVAILDQPTHHAFQQQAVFRRIRHAELWGKPRTNSIFSDQSDAKAING